MISSKLSKTSLNLMAICVRLLVVLFRLLVAVLPNINLLLRDGVSDTIALFLLCLSVIFHLPIA